MCIVDKSISGIVILATNRQISREVSYILAPRMQAILAKTPALTIQATHLDSLLDTHTGVQTHHNILDNILRGVRSSHVKAAIHAYRRDGSSQIPCLCGEVVTLPHSDNSRRTAAKLAAFILRATKYSKSKRSPLAAKNKYPPLASCITRLARPRSL